VPVDPILGVPIITQEVDVDDDKLYVFAMFEPGGQDWTVYNAGSFPYTYGVYSTVTNFIENFSSWAWIEVHPLTFKPIRALTHLNLTAKQGRSAGFGSNRGVVLRDITYIDYKTRVPTLVLDI